MSTNNVKRFSAPDANNRITPFVTLYEAHYDALAASHAELVTQRDELIASIEKITPWLSSYMKSCGTFFGDAFICRLELKEVEDTVTRIKSISALTRAKAAGGET